jgi:HEAT repeat protein
LDENWHENAAAQEIIPKLRSALKHPEYWVRQSAAEVLSKIGTGRTGETRHFAVSDAARHRRQAAATIFIEVLQDADPDMRQAAAEALGRMGDPAAKAALDAAQQDQDAGVRKAACAALAALESAA